MKINKRLVLIFCLIFFLALGIFFATTSSNKEVFDGEATLNDNGYFLNMEKLTGKQSQSLMLKQGDTLHVKYIKEAGKLEIKIYYYVTEPIYQSNDLETCDFDVVIPEDGRYYIEVTGQKAKGKLYCSQK